MHILYWQWHSFMGAGIEAAFRKLNIEYDVFTYQLKDWEEDECFQERLEEQIRKNAGYDAVFSVNYTPLITSVCKHYEIPYISWIYDSPVHIRNLEPMKEKCNRIYCFDRGQTEEYKAEGIQTFHMPLAADSSVFRVKDGNSNKTTKVYQADVSLVGQLYQTEYADYIAPLDEYLRGYLEGIVHAQKEVYGGYFLKDLITEELLGKLNAVYRKASGGKVQINARQLEYLLASEVTGRERFLVLALLSNHFDTVLYSGNSNMALSKVKQPGYVDYYHEMPQVFTESRINLNISLKTIRTGIPLRVLDILASGGFVISNYQEELMEYFTPGDDIVIYENMEDLYQKTDFYLKHEAERKRIMENGRQCLEQNFRFEDRIRKMLAI